MGVIAVGVESSLVEGETLDAVPVLTGAETLAMLARRACDAVAVGAHVLDMTVDGLVAVIGARQPDVPVVLIGDAGTTARFAVWEHVPAARGRVTPAIRRAAEVGRLRRALGRRNAAAAAQSIDERLDHVFRCGSIREMERLMILGRLARLDHNRTRSASSLDISVRTLRNKLRRYRTSVPRNAGLREDH